MGVRAIATEGPQPLTGKHGRHDYDHLQRLVRRLKAKTALDLDGTMTMAAQLLREAEIVALVHSMASLGTRP